MTLMHRIEAAIAKALQVRAGARLTPDVIADRAANATYYVLEAIREDNEAQLPAGYELGLPPKERKDLETFLGGDRPYPTDEEFNDERIK